MKIHHNRRFLILILALLFAISLVRCGGRSKCGMCHGSGYYNKKTCPACHGSGYSDYDPYEQYKGLYN